MDADTRWQELLGVKAFLGRALTPDDDKMPGGSPAVVLSHGFWQRQFGGDPSILNRTVRLNQLPMTIVGVMAPGFTGTVAGDIQSADSPRRDTSLDPLAGAEGGLLAGRDRMRCRSRRLPGIEPGAVVAAI
ncbi:MAG: ABC transporter permease [Acidobacteriia bacterium]|nr:ABC transporter permease [Terriglobia bacterium]